MTEATIALASVTFVLAVAAFINIWQTRRIHTRERRDDFVAQIADWAVQVMTLHHRHGQIEPSLIPPMLEGEVLVQDATLAAIDMRSIFDQSERCELAVARGGYLGSLAETFDTELSEAVNDTVKALGIVIAEFRPILDDLKSGAKPVQATPDFVPVVCATGKVLQRAKELIAQ